MINKGERCHPTIHQFMDFDREVQVQHQTDIFDEAAVFSPVPYHCLISEKIAAVVFHHNIKIFHECGLLS